MKQTLKSTAVSYSLMEHLGEGLNSVVYKAIRSDAFPIDSANKFARDRAKHGRRSTGPLTQPAQLIDAIK